MAAREFSALVTSCQHCDWMDEFLYFPIRLVLWENCVELTFAPSSARYRLELTEEALASGIHRRVRDAEVELLSVSFPESFPPDPEPYMLEGVELVARNIVAGQLRWAIFAASEFGSFVDIAESDERQAALILYTPEGFSVCYAADEDSRIVLAMDVQSGKAAEIVLSWKDSQLSVTRDCVDYAELESLVPEEELIYLIQDVRMSYMLIVCDHGFAVSSSGSVLNNNKEHSIVAISRDKKVLLISGMPAAFGRYCDRKGNVYDVTLPDKDQELSEQLWE